LEVSVRKKKKKEKIIKKYEKKNERIAKSGEVPE
jgi:hypothetical protein